MPLEMSQSAATRPRWWLIGLALLYASAGGAPDDLGRPLVRNHPPGEYLGEYECQAIAQDGAGVVYVADGIWLRAYDGVETRPLPPLPPDGAGVSELAASAAGEIFAAGPNLVGRIEGSGREAKFVSLAQHLPAGGRDIANIRHVTASGNTVCFSDDEKLLVWRDERFSVVPCPSPPDSHGARLHAIGQSLYVSVAGRPLARLDGERLTVVADGPIVRECPIVAMGPGRTAGTLVLLTSERGFFQLDRAGKVSPLAVDANRRLAGKRVFRALQLADGSWVVGFSAVSGDGGMRFAPDGQYEGALDMSVGLIVKTLRTFCVDQEGGLFIGTEMGFSRVEWPSDTTVFDTLNGLGNGAVTSIERYDGVLFVTTNEGVFRLVPSSESGRPAHFVPSQPPPPTRAQSRSYSETVAAPLPSRVRAAVGAVSCLYDESGPAGRVVWVGGEDGLARIDASHPRTSAPPLRVILRSAQVSPEAELEPEHAPLTFSYSAPRFGYASNVTYQTRLAGLDRAWSTWTNQRERSYPHLTPGRYRFEVRARDADAISSEPVSLAFSVLSPWWLSAWAIVGYLAAAAGLVAGLVQWRTRTLRQRAATLERVVAERTAELADKNRELTRLHRLESEEKIAARLAEETARLEVLRYQLNPHFLFNTLASISSSLPPGRSSARAMLERLAEFCRLTLHRSDEREWTTLGDEMRLIEAYLAIEKSRWEDMLTVEIACDPALTRERLPYFLLLPLVENALKYGRATSADRVGIRLAARRDPASGGLTLEVANTGEWIESAAPKRVPTLGIGLENLRQRLARYFPGAHSFTFAHGGGWVTATLVLTTESTAPVL